MPLSAAEASEIIVAAARAVLAKVDSREWTHAARSASFELMKISGAATSQSGSFRLSEADTIPPPPPREK